MRSVHLAIIIVLVFLAVSICPGSATVTLSMGLTDSPDPVMPGNQLTYTITATNSGDETSSPRIDLAYDPNLDYVSGSPLSNQEIQGFPFTSPAFWITTTPPFLERIVEIDPGSSYVITVITRVKPETPCGTTITSTATVLSQPDGVPSSASATTSTATTCGIPAPEFPSPAIPVTILVGLAFGILAIRARVG
jgi:hypothetical protein